MSAGELLREYLIFAPAAIVADALAWLLIGTGAFAWWRRRRARRSSSGAGAP